MEMKNRPSAGSFLKVVSSDSKWYGKTGKLVFYRTPKVVAMKFEGNDKHIDFNINEVVVTNPPNGDSNFGASCDSREIPV